MTVFQKLSPVGGGKSAAQNYGRADQLRGLEAFICGQQGFAAHSPPGTHRLRSQGVGKVGFRGLVGSVG